MPTITIIFTGSDDRRAPRALDLCSPAKFHHMWWSFASRGSRSSACGGADLVRGSRSSAWRVRRCARLLVKAAKDSWGFGLAALSATNQHNISAHNPSSYPGASLFKLLDFANPKGPRRITDIFLYLGHARARDKVHIILALISFQSMELKVQINFLDNLINFWSFRISYSPSSVESSNSAHP